MKENPKQLPSLALAYIGDAVYELFIREKLIEDGKRKTNDLHPNAVKLVSSKGQYNSYLKIEAILTDEEVKIAKCARNKKLNAPKNADKKEYSYATAFEALIGYLYLNGDTDRLNEIMNKAIGE